MNYRCCRSASIEALLFVGSFDYKTNRMDKLSCRLSISPGRGEDEAVNATCANIAKLLVSLPG